MAENIVKRYGRFTAVDGISLSVRSNSVFGFLGPNGAGKTTMMRILLGLSMPDSGKAELLGKDLFRQKDEILSMVGAVIEAPSFFEYLTAYENLYYLSRISAKLPAAQIWKTLETVGLTEVAHKRVGAFSYGMKQRLGIAQALLPASRLIFLDEPTNGLDPHGIAGVRSLIRRLCAQEGITFFISSHMLGEVESICDRVAIIDKGRLICESSVSDLLESQRCIELKTDQPDAFLSFCSKKEINCKRVEGESGKFLIPGDEGDIPDLVFSLVAESVKILSVGKRKTSLEEIFVEYTGKDRKNTSSDRF